MDYRNVLYSEARTAIRVINWTGEKPRVGTSYAIRKRSTQNYGCSQRATLQVIDEVFNIECAEFVVRVTSVHSYDPKATLLCRHKAGT